MVGINARQSKMLDRIKANWGKLMQKTLLSSDVCTECDPAKVWNKMNIVVRYTAQSTWSEALKITESIVFRIFKN